MLTWPDYTVPAMEVELSEARRTFETNFFAVIAMCQTFLPLLIKAKGTIVQVGSVAGVRIWGPPITASTDPDRSSPTCLARSTTPLKPHCTPSATPYESSLLRSGVYPHRNPTPTLMLTQTDSVHVTTVVTGGVQSRIARTKRTLLPNSMYTPIEAEYTRRVTHSQHNAMPHEAYAGSVVAQVLYGPAPWRWLWPWARGRKAWIWEGHRSWLIWLLVGGWAWNGLFGRIMTNMFKLTKIKKALSK